MCHVSRIAHKAWMYSLMGGVVITSPRDGTLPAPQKFSPSTHNHSLLPSSKDNDWVWLLWDHVFGFRHSFITRVWISEHWSLVLLVFELYMIESLFNILDLVSFSHLKKIATFLLYVALVCPFSQLHSFIVWIGSNWCSHPTCWWTFG